jgi:formylglycine-generating enzyme required for sulfatase activity
LVKIEEEMMKKSTLILGIFAIFLAIMLTGCPAPTTTPVPVAGDKQSYTADSVTFKMIYVPGKTFPTGTDDGGTATVTGGYWIGETLVTYELWNTVYLWATDTARGANKYTFANAGNQGWGSGTTNQHPVVVINWRDAMVWCNAATEWYNAKTGSSFSCVYSYITVLRDSSNANASALDNATASTTAKGFRLLTANEFELAARWRNNNTNTVNGYSNPWFTHGNSASGAISYYNDPANPTATEDVAWDSVNSPTGTQAVKGMPANSLGLYDMSGNAMVWCFDLYPTTTDRVMRGGSWGWGANGLQVGYIWHKAPAIAFNDVDLRLGKSQ